MKAQVGSTFTDAAGAVWTVRATSDEYVAVGRWCDPEPITMTRDEWDATVAELARAAARHDAHDDAMDGRMWALTGGLHP